MTANDPTSKSQTESISLQFDLRHPPEKVWKALTEPELLAKWLLPVIGFDVEPGTAFQFQSQPQPGWDGVVHCRLLEVEPLHRIAYTWVVGDLDTVVTFTLTPTESGTSLSLIHTGFKPEQKQNVAGARYGWKMMGEQLVDLLSTL
jgi:uncharacterized protein YndB with AHSA1/START domain